MDSTPKIFDRSGPGPGPGRVQKKHNWAGPGRFRVRKNFNRVGSGSKKLYRSGPGRVGSGSKKSWTRRSLMTSRSLILNDDRVPGIGWNWFRRRNWFLNVQYCGIGWLLSKGQTEKIRKLGSNKFSKRRNHENSLFGCEVFWHWRCL